MNFRIGQLVCLLPLTSLLACSVATEPSTGAGRTESTTIAADPISEAHQASMAPTDHKTLLASLTVEKDHTLGFFELEPGTTAVIEDALLGMKPVLPENASKLPLAEIYRHFAPTGAAVPAEVTEADLRHGSVAILAEGTTKPQPTTSPDGEPSGHAVTPDTAADNNWFNENFCNGANGCTFGSSHIVIQSNNSITYGYIAGMNGSEATASATLYFYYWKCICADTVLWWCEDYACNWAYVAGGTYNILPGHWASVSYTEGSATTYYWQMYGGAQQMGMSARWH